MLLTVDVGNTNIGFGLFEADKLVHQFRCESARQRTADEYAVFLRQMFGLRELDYKKISAGIIASVVPALTDVLVEAVRRAFAREPLVVGSKMRSGMAILYERPREVGADRIVNAVAAYEQVKGGVIVVDFGTATTFDCVIAKGRVPRRRHRTGDPDQRRRALRTSGQTAPGRDRQTGAGGRAKPGAVDAVGVVYGYAGLVDGVVARIKAELGYPCAVIGTGGLAGLIAPQTASIERVDDALTLQGLRLLYERNVDA